MASPVDYNALRVVRSIVEKCTDGDPGYNPHTEGTDARWIFDWWKAAKPLARRPIYEAWKGKRPPIGAIEVGGGFCQADVLDSDHYQLKKGMALRAELDADDYDLEGDTEEEKLANPSNAYFWREVPDTKSYWIEPTAEAFERCKRRMLEIDDEHASAGFGEDRFYHWGEYFNYHTIDFAAEPDYVRRAVAALKQWDSDRGQRGSSDAAEYAVRNPDSDFEDVETKLYAIIDQGGFEGDARETKQTSIDAFLSKGPGSGKRARKE